MYKHILIATDGSELATKGLNEGLRLARDLGASVTLVTVTEPWSSFAMAEAARSGTTNPIAIFEKAANEEAQAVLEAAAKIARNAGVAVETLHIPDQHPADGIIQAAEDKGVDLIVMASHGRRGASRLLLGSQTAEVVTRAGLPVLVIR